MEVNLLSLVDISMSQSSPHEYYDVFRNTVVASLKPSGSVLRWKNFYKLDADEDISPTFEELILLTCLYSWDARLPKKVKRLLEHQVGPGFSLMDWKEQILTWLPFILITDTLEELSSLDAALIEAKQEMEGQDDELAHLQRRSSTRSEEDDDEGRHCTPDIESKRKISETTRTEPEPPIKRQRAESAQLRPSVDIGDVEPKEETVIDVEPCLLHDDASGRQTRECGKRTGTRRRPVANGKRFVCSQCDHRAATKRALARHTKLEHIKENDDGDDLLENDEEWSCQGVIPERNSQSPREGECDVRGTADMLRISKHPTREQIDCNLCDFKTLTKGAMRKHMAHCHEEAKPTKVLEDETAVEKKLRRGKGRNPKGRAPRKKLLPLEQRSQFICDLCCHTTYTKRAMNNHKAVKHEGRKDFMCDQCDKRFGYVDDLKRHRLSMHENVRYTCETCGFQTSHPGSLSGHVKRVHRNVRTALCDQCDYKAWCRSALAKHQRAVHEKLKAYACDLCSFTTANPSSIQRHRFSVHFKKARYLCPHCDCAMVLRYNLKKHIESVHKLVVPLNSLQSSDFPVESVKDEVGSPKTG